MNKKILAPILIFLIILIGIAIPKLTVKDSVETDEEFRNNVMQSLNIHYDNPLERIALFLGKSRIISATKLSAETESFTIFRIPLGFFYGTPDMKLSINFNPSDDWSVGEEDENENDLWNNFVDQEQNIKFKYPKELIAEYTSTVEWPPIVSISEGKLVCLETPLESSFPERTSLIQVDDRLYCVEAISEGAAGSVYTEYTYSTSLNEKLIKTSFTLQFPRCDNYDEDKKIECENEREVFDIDGIVDRIVKSVEYIEEN